MGKPLALDPQDALAVRRVFEEFASKYHLPLHELLATVFAEHAVPVSAFDDVRSPLESVVAYLHEERGLTISAIAKALGRDTSTISQAATHSRARTPARAHATPTPYLIPLAALRDTDCSILEATVSELRERYELTYACIGRLLHRDERTVWTAHSRARTKHLNGSHVRSANVASGRTVRGGKRSG